jgi:hypothetical protein
MRAFALVLFCAFLGSAHAGEKLSGSSVEVRTILAFKVSDGAAQKLVPEGWEISPPVAGPTKGSNLILLLIDSISALDADGKAVTPLRGAVFAIPARKKGTEAAITMVVYGIVGKDATPGAYGVYVPGQTANERKVKTAMDGKAVADETWLVRSDDENAIEAQVQWERATTAQAKLEAKVYSGAKPEFFRIYRWEQVADVARSTPMGVDRVTRISVKGSGSKLGPLFDGSEQLVGVISLPLYARTVFLPE